MLRWVAFAVLSGATCVAQVTGRFSVDKVAYAPGEPAFLTFTLRNDGNETVYIQSADPYSFCSGYSVHVVRNATDSPSCYLNGFAGSCLGSQFPLAPGATHTDRILLNYSNPSHGSREPVVRLPGEYTVSAKREVSFSSSNDFLTAQQEKTFKQELYLRVDADLAVPDDTFGPFVAQLHADDWIVKKQAARTLATLAPAQLEPLLLTFAQSTDIAVRDEAPDALANLNSTASLKALAGLAEHEEPGSYASMRSAELLGEKHDPAWFPVLLALADRNAAIDIYHQYAAKAGGTLAVATLAARLRVAKPEGRLPLLYALGETGNKAAVPFLIDSLPGPSAASDEELKSQAGQIDSILKQLTHRTALPKGSSGDLRSLRQRWQRWWLTEGTNAPTYFSEDCGPVEAIP